MSLSNRDKLNAYQREWRAKNPDRVLFYNKQEYMKELKKKWIQTHHEQQKRILNEWYEKNKDKLKQKVPCEICGKHYQPNNVYHHKKTKFHQLALEKLSEN